MSEAGEVVSDVAEVPARPANGAARGNGSSGAAAAAVATRRTTDAPPVLSFTMIVRNSDVELLERCLISIRRRAPQAEIVVVDTCSSNETPEVARRYADVFEVYRGPRGDWNEEMFAFDDAAAARNRSLELAHGRWVCWVDDDDVLPEPEETERLLKLNGYWRLPVDEKKIADKELSKSGPVYLEDLLAWVEKNQPSVDAFICPYLYERDANDVAKTWQPRERIVKNNGKWTWRRPAHEVLVPKDPMTPLVMAPLPHFLIVHEKKFDAESRLFSLRRHFDILIKDYDRGVRNCMDLLYLENFSMFLCPQRREEFLDAAYRASTTPADRMRVLVRAGNFAAEQGYVYDAIEHYASAVEMRPDLPDAYAAGAKFFEHYEDYLRAADWFAKAANASKGAMDSEVSPREQDIDFRGHAADSWRKVALGCVQDGSPQGQEAARISYDKAIAEMVRAAQSLAIGPESQLADCFLRVLKNERRAIDAAAAVGLLHDHLLANDESEKAATLLDVVPHDLQDHPVVVGKLEPTAREVTRHLTDRDAYSEFYASSGTGAVMTDFAAWKPDARVLFLIDWVKKEKPDARILEVGSHDGLTAIPLLEACPGVHYVAVEPGEGARAQLVKNKEQFAPAADLQVCAGLIYADRDGVRLDVPEVSTSDWLQAFDAVVFYEVIEHVPSPRETLVELLRYLKPSGRLFVSTPLGSFDRGHPPQKALTGVERGHLGHVRALSMRDLHELVASADARVVDCNADAGLAGVGVTQFASCEKSAPWRAERREKPVSFIVPSALWPWNASEVLGTGMGASETQIVHVAQQLAAERGVDVYAPVPVDYVARTEVHHRVSYWHKRSWRRVSKDATAIISRSPATAQLLDEAVGADLDKILWLQDTWYGDLPNFWQRYRAVVCVSEWHRNLEVSAVGGERTPEELARFRVIKNGVVPEWFSGDAPAREPHRFIYASSPDRGLIALLKMWPKIREVWPDATLGVFYGWQGMMRLSGGMDPTWVQRHREMREAWLKFCRQPGVEDRGRISGRSLVREFQRASVWPYPTAFTETCCTAAMEARAAGCVPVCTPLAGLCESAKCPQTIYVERPADFTDSVLEQPDHAYVAKFIDAMRAGVETSVGEREKMSAQAREEECVDRRVAQWRELLK